MRKNGAYMKTEDVIENMQKDNEERGPGSTAQIRDALIKADADVTCIEPDKRFRKILKVLKKKNKQEVFILSRCFYGKRSILLIFNLLLFSMFCILFLSQLKLMS